jgi:hypothetical protein
MKKILLILAISFSISTIAQTAVSNDLVVTTPTRDTMYIINNPNGKLIYSSWLIEPEAEGYRPTVFLVPSLEPYRCCATRKKCKRKNKIK